jgi:diamine N-acetyltransferase
VHSIDTIRVADDDGELIGYVQFSDVRIPEVDAEPEDLELHRVYVDTRRQGEGTGRALLDAALSHPRSRAASRVYLQVWKENRKALELYKTLGFRTVGATQVTIGSEEVGDDLVMVLVR